MDEFMIAALREVDELTPSSPAIAPPRAPVYPSDASPVGVMRQAGATYSSALDYYVLADGTVITGAEVHSNFSAALQRAIAALSKVAHD